MKAAAWIEAHKLNVCHVFTVDDLDPSTAAARVSETAAIVGSMINIGTDSARRRRWYITTEVIGKGSRPEY